MRKSKNLFKLTLVILIIGVAACAYNENSPPIEADYNTLSINGLENLVINAISPNMRVGDIVRFGNYNWRALAVQDGQALLLMERIWDFRPFHRTGGDIIWQNSSLRRELNNEFLNSFSEEDRAKIIRTQNSNPNNPWYNTIGGNDTEDYIFVLSLEELVKYFGDSGQLRNRPEYVAFWISDQYNDSRIAYDENGVASFWWLRSPGFDNRRAVDVTSFDGSVIMYGNGVVDHGSGVRPALWVNIF